MDTLCIHHQCPDPAPSYLWLLVGPCTPSPSTSTSSPYLHSPCPTQASGEWRLPSGGSPRQSGRAASTELNRRIKGCTSLAELGQLLQGQRGQLDKHHYPSAFVHALKLASGRQGGPGRALGGGSAEDGALALALAAELFDQHLGRMDGRALSNAFHAMVKARHEPANGLRGRVLAALLAGGGARLRDDSLQGTSNVLWALATLHQQRGERIDSAAVATLVHVAGGKLRDDNAAPQALSNIAWALAVLGHQDHDFMGELLAAAQAQLRAFEPQALSNTLWAAATLGLLLPLSFLGAFLAVAEAQLHAFKPQELSNTLWAAATLGLPLPPSFLGACLAAAAAQLHAFKPQDLSNTLWAVATLELPVPAGFLGAFLAAAEAQLPACKPQDFSNMAWALATMALDVGHGSNRSLGELLGQPPSAQPGWPKAQLQRFLDALADEAAKRLSHGSRSDAGWDAQALANTIWAFSELRHFHAGLWGAITVESLARCGRGEDSGWTGQAVSNLALGLARLRAVERGGATDPVLGQLLQRLGSGLAAERPGAFNEQDVCNLAWAHAAAGGPHCAWLMEGLVLPLANNPDSLAPEEKSQLLQYLLAMELPGSAMPPAVAQRPEYRSLRQLGVEAHQAQVQERSKQAPSQLQRGVHVAAQRLAARGMLLSAGLEQLSPSGLFSVDVAVVLPGGGRVAVEVDGPTHFSSNWDAAGRPVGVAAATLLRDRLLPAVEPGWAVASVPFHGWGAFGGDVGAEERCLLRLLGLEGGGPAAGPRGPVAAAGRGREEEEDGKGGGHHAGGRSGGRNSSGKLERRV